MGVYTAQMTMFSLGATVCRICGRSLTNPVSIQRGIGPICSGRGYRGGSSTVMKDDSGLCDNHIMEPLENGLVLRRDERGVWTNCPHVVIHHSPTGFEFGYGGSGPADLALNVVEVLLNRLGHDGPRMKCFDGECFEEAFVLHQAFKWKFIAGAHRDEGARIPYQRMLEWIGAPHGTG